MLVREWMVSDPITIEPETCLAVAKKLMEENGVHFLPVVSAGKLVGILTIHDLEAATAHWAAEMCRGDYLNLLCGAEAQEIMIKNPITIGENDTLEDAAELMFNHDISHLPVVTNDDELVGIISEKDVLKGFVNVSKRAWKMSSSYSSL